MKSDASVVTWGEGDCGGDSSCEASRLVSVRRLFAWTDGFATLREDGPVVVWGKPSRHLTQDVANRLHNIVQVEETCWQYAALRADGIVII